MKKAFFLLMTVGALFAACQNDTEKQFDGWIVDATMNTVTVQALTGADTHIFSLEDADTSEAYGLLLGNLISVTYKGELEDVTPATKVAADETYAKAVGQWTASDPINPGEKMGIELKIEGEASSINMATLPIDSWELQGQVDRIILKGRSLGNGESIDFEKEVSIVEKEGKLYIDFEGLLLEKAE